MGEGKASSATWSECEARTREEKGSTGEGASITGRKTLQLLHVSDVGLDTGRSTVVCDARS